MVSKVGVPVILGAIVACPSAYVQSLNLYRATPAQHSCRVEELVVCAVVSWCWYSEASVYKGTLPMVYRVCALLYCDCMSRNHGLATKGGTALLPTRPCSRFGARVFLLGSVEQSRFGYSLISYSHRCKFNDLTAMLLCVSSNGTDVVYCAHLWWLVQPPVALPSLQPKESAPSHQLRQGMLYHAFDAVFPTGYQRRQLN